MFELLRDPVSSASHLITAAWAVFATLLMLRLCPRDRRVPVFIYGVTMIVLFLASGVFHGLHYASDDEFRFFQKLDMSAVYLLIAGTNTPFLAILLRAPWRERFLGMVWLCAAAGVSSLWLAPRPPFTLVVGCYLVLGWLGIVPMYHYYRAVGGRAMRWVWFGAGLYTLGAVCELTRWPVIIPGWVQAHEVLHLCDSAASLAFFIFVFRYVITYNVPEPRYVDAVAKDDGVGTAIPALAIAASEPLFSRGVRSPILGR